MQMLTKGLVVLYRESEREVRYFDALFQWHTTVSLNVVFLSANHTILVSYQRKCVYVCV